MYVYENAINNICFETFHCEYWDEKKLKCILGRSEINNFNLTPLNRRLFNWLVGYCRFGCLFLCIKENAKKCVKYEKNRKLYKPT
jgi:uncharacterized protein YutD